MFLTRYLYSKVRESNSTFVSLILGKEELDFLKKYDVEYHEEGDKYLVNCDKLKSLFCHC